MLAGIEETFLAREPIEVSGGRTAIDALLAGLIDYAGLFPPAGLTMRTAVENYRRYRGGKHAHALGRFIVDIEGIEELLATAGDFSDLSLSVIVSQGSQVLRVLRLIDKGVPIEAVEIKCAAEDAEKVTQGLPAELETYVEVPIQEVTSELLRTISGVGGRVKIRMGGVTPEAFPSTHAVARALAAFVQAGLSFKATAGLHHPIRAQHRLTYAQDSPSDMMHGFINLMCATALIRFDAGHSEAERALEEQDPASWSISAQALAWRTHSWSSERLSETRKMFTSFGSCSFEEPIGDLEMLGWL